MEKFKENANREPFLSSERNLRIIGRPIWYSLKSTQEPKWISKLRSFWWGNQSTALTSTIWRKLTTFEEDPKHLGLLWRVLNMREEMTSNDQKSRVTLQALEGSQQNPTSLNFSAFSRLLEFQMGAFAGSVDVGVCKQKGVTRLYIPEIFFLITNLLPLAQKLSRFYEAPENEQNHLSICLNTQHKNLRPSKLLEFSKEETN